MWRKLVVKCLMFYFSSLEMAVKILVPGTQSAKLPVIAPPTDWSVQFLWLTSGRFETFPQLWLLWDFCSLRSRLFEGRKKRSKGRKNPNKCKKSFSTCSAWTLNCSWKHLKAFFLWGYLITVCLWCTYSLDYTWWPKVGRRKKDLRSHKSTRGDFKDCRWIFVIGALIGARREIAPGQSGGSCYLFI